MHYGPCFVIPRSLSTLYRCSLTTVAQDKPYHEKPLIRDCFNRKGSCTLFTPYLDVANIIEVTIYSEVIKMRKHFLIQDVLSITNESMLNLNQFEYGHDITVQCIHSHCFSIRKISPQMQNMMLCIVVDVPYDLMFILNVG